MAEDPKSKLDAIRERQLRRNREAQEAEGTARQDEQRLEEAARTVLKRWGTEIKPMILDLQSSINSRIEDVGLELVVIQATPKLPQVGLIQVQLWMMGTRTDHYLNIEWMPQEVIRIIRGQTVPGLQRLTEINAPYRDELETVLVDFIDVTTA